jgi:hypothetical protein
MILAHLVRQPCNKKGGSKKMKTRMFVSVLILVITVLVIAGICANKLHASKVDKSLYSIWVNEEYLDYAKWVHKPDGKCFSYSSISDAEPIMEGRFLIEDKWSDEASNFYYKVLIEWDNYPYDGEGTSTWYVLYIIDSSGDSIKSAQSGVNYPEITNDTWLRIYYRQE